MANTYGLDPIVQLGDGTALGYGESAVKTNMAEVGKPTNGALWLSVFAKTAISIATVEYLSVELISYSDDTIGSAIAPFNTGNNGGNVSYGGADAETNAHLYLLHKTSGDDELDFAAGDLICDIGIPEATLNAIGHNHIAVSTITDKTAPGTDETIDVILHAKV
jgi:hypothetical protein